MSYTMNNSFHSICQVHICSICLCCFAMYSSCNISKCNFVLNKHVLGPESYVLTFFWHAQNCTAHALIPRYYHTGQCSEDNSSHDTGILSVYVFFLIIRLHKIAWFVFVGICLKYYFSTLDHQVFLKDGMGTNNSTKFGKVPSSTFTVVWASWRLLFISNSTVCSPVC